MATHVVTEEAEWPTDTVGGGAVDSVNGQLPDITGNVVLDADDVGADPEGAAALAIQLTEKGAANGVATLDSGGDVPLSQLGNVSGVGGGAVSSVNRLIGDIDLGLDKVIGGFSKTDPTRTSAVNAAAPLTISTPDGTGQVVEPAVEYIPEGWNGHKYWGLITGYTGGDAAKENPAVYYSDDGTTWTPTPGVPFPLVAKPTGGNNADPDLVLGPDGNLHGFYITINFPAGQQSVWWTTSSNGVSWSTPAAVFQSATGTEAAIGPVFRYDKANNRWVCWYVDSHNAALIYPIKRRTCPGTSPGGTWSAATTCTVTGVPGGRTPWEKHIAKRGDQLHMVTTFADLGTGGGNTTLHFGVSDDDGLSWAFNPTPLLSPSVSGWDNSTVYRGDMVPVDDGGTGLYELWYSARSSTGVWKFGRTTIYGGAGPQGSTGPAGPPGSSGIAFPGLAAPPMWGQVLDTAPAAPGANVVYGCRIVVPNDGVLRDISVYVGTSSGNYRVGIYDTGDALNGTRTRLYASGVVAMGAANGWRIIADPGLTVSAGDQLDLAINCDNGSATFGRILLTNAAVGQLPTSFVPTSGLASPKVNWSNAPGSFVMPTGVSEANAANNASMFPLIARIAAS